MATKATKRKPAAKPAKSAKPAKKRAVKKATPYRPRPTASETLLGRVIRQKSAAIANQGQTILKLQRELRDTKAASRVGKFAPEATAKQILKAIDDWAAERGDRHGMEHRHGMERKRLWDVLCAMRGPDEAGNESVSGYDTKWKTTAIVRHHSLPALAGNMAMTSDKPLSDAAKVLTDPATRAAIGFHFRDHIRKAIQALGVPVGSPIFP